MCGNINRERTCRAGTDVSVLVDRHPDIAADISGAEMRHSALKALRPRIRDYDHPVWGLMRDLPSILLFPTRPHITGKEMESLDREVRDP